MRTKNPITVLGPDGRPLAAASVYTRVRATGADATVYAASSGATPGSNPATTDSKGRVTQWLERGAYDSTVTATGMDPYVESWESAPGGDQGIDTAWVADGAVTVPKAALTSMLLADLYANRPPASAALNGVRFFATDKLMEWQCVAGVWVLVAAFAAPATALPSSPVDGQRAVLRPDSTNHPDVQWALVWDNTSGHWRYLGGSPIAYKPAGWNPANVGYTDTATPADHTLTPPKGGRYRVRYHGVGRQINGGTSEFALTVFWAGVTQHAGGGVGTREYLYNNTFSGIDLAVLTDERANGSALTFKYQNAGPAAEISASYIEVEPLYLLP